MNFNIYVNKEMGKKIARMAKAMRLSRKSIVNEELEDWLNKQASSKWPKGFFDFDPVEDIPNFKDCE
jgi:hypothetical protein